MVRYEVTFKAELDLGSLGAPEEMVQEAAQAIRLGIAVDPNTQVTHVEVKNGVIYSDASMTVDAQDEQDAIVQVQQYLDEQTASVSDITPWKTHSFKGRKVV